MTDISLNEKDQSLQDNSIDKINENRINKKLKPEVPVFRVTSAMRREQHRLDCQPVDHNAIERFIEKENK